MPHPLTKKMADLHERVLAEWFGGRQTRGSGNQFNNPMDGRQDRYRKLFAFAWDGKSTRGQSIGVGRRMWNKVVDQAGGERPMLALRFYDTDSLTVGLDLAVISMDDFREMEASLADLEDLRVQVDALVRVQMETEKEKVVRLCRARGALIGGGEAICTMEAGHPDLTHMGHNTSPPYEMVSWFEQQRRVFPPSTGGPNEMARERSQVALPADEAEAHRELS